MRGRMLAILAGLVLAAGVQADPPEGYPFVPYDQGRQLAREQGKPIFLYFGRYGCGYCDKTNREAFSVPEVRDRYTEHYVLVYVDAESGRRLKLPTGERITEKELGTRFNAFVTPVFLFLDTDGNPLLKQAGLRTAGDFLAYDDYVRGGEYRTRSFKDFEASRR